MKYRVIFYKEKCVGCGLCTDICPEIFQLIASGIRLKKQVINEDEQEILKKVKKAIELCPVNAIDIVEEE